MGCGASNEVCGTKPAPADESGVDSDWAELTAEQKEEALDLCKALPDLCAEFPTVLRFTSKGKVGKASEAYAKMCATVDAVARDSLCQAIDLCQTINYEEVLDTLLSAAQHCTRSSLLGARLLGVQHCVQRLLLSAVRQGENVTQWQGPWQEVMAVIRQTCRERAAQARAAKAGKTVSMSNSLLDLYLTRVELTLTHLEAKDVVLSVGKSVGMLLIGAVKSVAMTRVDGMLLEGLQKTAGLALDAIRRSITHTCFAQLALIEQLAISADHCVSQDWTTLRDRLRRVHDQHFKLGSTGMWEPTAGRWEPKAAFTALLADLLVGVGGSSCSFHTLPSEDVKMICLGSGDFIGLIDLMSLGNDPRGRRDEDPSLVLLAGWAQSLFANPKSLDEWLREGLTLLASEVRRVGEERVDALLTEMTIKLVKQLEMAVQQELRADSTHHHKRRQAKTALAALCQEAEAMRTAAQQVQASAKLALRVAERAKKLLHTVGGLSPKDVAMSALWTLTRRLQQYCAVPIADKVLNMDEGIVTAHLEATGAHLKTELEKVSLEMLQKREVMKSLPATMKEAAEQPELGRRWSEALQGLPILEEVCQVLLKSCIAKAPCQGQAAPRVEELEALLRDKVAPRLQKCVRCVQRAHDEKRSVDDDTQSTVIQGSIRKAIMCLGCEPAEGKVSSDVMKAVLLEMAPCFKLEELSQILNEGEVSVITELRKIEQFFEQSLSNASSSGYLLRPYVQHLSAYADTMCTLLEEVRDHAGMADAAIERSLLSPFKSAHRVLASQPAESQLEEPLHLMEKARDSVKEVRLLGADEFPQVEGRCWTECAANPAVQDLHVHLAALSDLCAGLQGLAQTKLPALEGEDVAEKLKKLKKWLDGEGNKAKERAMDVARDLKVRAGEELERMAKAVGGEEAVEALSQAFAPMAGLVQEAARGLLASHSSEVWHVREVAAVSSLRVLSVPRPDVRVVSAPRPQVANLGLQPHARPPPPSPPPASDVLDPCSEERERDTVCRTLQASVMRCLSFEQRPEVRAVLSGGDTLARELNTLRRLPRVRQAGYDYEGGVEDGELDEEAVAERRQAGWTAVQAEVEQQTEAQLAELEELQRKVEQEPDELKKQKSLVRCRAILAELAVASHNLRDLSTNHRVVVGFLGNMASRLEGIGSQLDKLQEDVSALRGDMKRLVGRPVLEVLEEQRDRRVAQYQQLRHEVYIPVEGVRKDVNGQFLLDEIESRFDLLTDVKKFLKSEEQSTLLLSGPAGSGKSTFVHELQLFLDAEYVKEQRGREEETLQVVVLTVSLPTLQNPLGDLFKEAMVQKELRDTQIHELRELVQNGEVQLVFLLDGYDEMRQENLFKNLYVTNNLEQYRKRSDPERRCHPKVIISTRTELLDRNMKYERSFLPDEAGTQDAVVSKAFLELRIAPFSEKLQDFVNARVALQLLNSWQRLVGPLVPLPHDQAHRLTETVAEAWEGKKMLGDGGNEEEKKGKMSGERMLWFAVRNALTVSGGIGQLIESDVSSVVKTIAGYKTGALGADEQATTVMKVASVMAGAMEVVPEHLSHILQAFADQHRDTQQLWLPQQYLDAFESIPELRELTTTPFMVRIVTEILRELEAIKSTDASVKQRLNMLLEEDAVRVIWHRIKSFRDDQDAKTIDQRYVADKASRQARRNEAQQGPQRTPAELYTLIQDCSRLLLKHNLLYSQPRLREVADLYLRASSGQGLQKEELAGKSNVGRVSHIGQNCVEEKEVSTGCGGETDLDEDDAEGTVDHVLEELVTSEVESREKEEAAAFCSVAMGHVLQQALHRPPVRMRQIYAMFTEAWVEREAGKRAIHGVFDPAKVRREGMEFARQLALTMVAENVSKVSTQPTSELFHTQSVWDPFLHTSSHLREAALRAAPCKSSDVVLTFVHKTLQEHLCAEALRSTLHDILQRQAVPLKDLLQHLQEEVRGGSDHPPDASCAEAVTETARELRGSCEEIAPPTGGAKASLAGEGDSPGQVAERDVEKEAQAAAIAKALMRAEVQLLESGWGYVELQREDAVRDFLTDVYLDELSFRDEVRFLVLWVRAQARRPPVRPAWAILEQNVRAVLQGTLPKRAGGSLMHVAAADGSYMVLAQLLRTLEDASAGSVLAEQLKRRDGQGRTPLFVAAQYGQALTLACLLTQPGAPRDGVSSADIASETSGADFNHFDLEGRTPTHVAAS
ncbi:hypothetical protein CYMTET_49697, partial [Cymbomonas tetramitiformis]